MHLHNRFDILFVLAISSSFAIKHINWEVMMVNRSYQIFLPCNACACTIVYYSAMENPGKSWNFNLTLENPGIWSLNLAGNPIIMILR